MLQYKSDKTFSLFEWLYPKKELLFLLHCVSRKKLTFSAEIKLRFTQYCVQLLVKCIWPCDIAVPCIVYLYSRVQGSDFRFTFCIQHCRAEML